MKPSHDCIRRRDWSVRDVDISTARALVESQHYAKGASNTAVYLHGLYRSVGGESECLGATWWIPPTKAAAKATYPENWEGVLSLSRLVIHPDVPANACSFLLARSRHAIDRKRWPCLVTYADERMGHTGAIYRADNWTYIGLTKPEPCYLLNGRQVARKAGRRSRTHAEMLALGAEMVGKSAKHKFVHLAAA